MCIDERLTHTTHQSVVMWIEGLMWWCLNQIVNHTLYASPSPWYCHKNIHALTSLTYPSSGVCLNIGLDGLDEFQSPEYVIDHLMCILQKTSLWFLPQKKCNFCKGFSTYIWSVVHALIYLCWACGLNPKDDQGCKIDQFYSNLFIQLLMCLS